METLETRIKKLENVEEQISIAPLVVIRWNKYVPEDREQCPKYNDLLEMSPRRGILEMNLNCASCTYDCEHRIRL